ncbi:MAG: hypothetical protein JXB49_34265 [Bacteroidales bacterium]|nr:hypothetical protein [Bacteroidales bacterium]
MSSFEKATISENRELKQYIALKNIVQILKEGKEIGCSLQQICDILSRSYPFTSKVSVCISYDQAVYTSKPFKSSKWIEKQTFETPDKNEGIIEIYFPGEYIESLDKDSLVKDTEFIESVASLIMGIISKKRLEKLHYDNTERLKELKGINRTTEILKKGATLEESLQEICNVLPEAWQYPQDTVARIMYEDKIFISNGFKETPWIQRQNFETPDNKKGVIEVFYIKEFPNEFEGPFLKEERSLIDNLAALISGSVSRNALQDLLIKNTERLKELRGINQTSTILKQSSSIEEALEIICSILPEAWQFPEYTAARITFEKEVFTTPNFKKTRWVQKQEFETPGNKKGLIEICYLKEFPKADEGPFLKEERHLLINLANLIAGSATKEVLFKLIGENKERLKELRAINLTSRLIEENKPVDETLQEICNILPKSWQYPRYTVVRIIFEGKTYTSKKFKETEWVQKENFLTIDNKKGTIEVFYLKLFPRIYEGPFLKEERHLIINIGKLISGYLNNYKGREIYNLNILKERSTQKAEEYRKSLIKDKQSLQLFFNQQILDKYIYLDMMKHKVKEILFVATLYDAFILENEDSFFEQFMGEIYHYSLFSLPRITGVTTTEEALELIETTHFDLVLLMVGLDKEKPIDISNKIRKKQPNLPIYLLLNQKSNITYFEELVPHIDSIDKTFVWSGDSNIFFAIVKSIEDSANVENDTKVGLVRVILLIEDSAQYYSKYLQILYSIVFGQVQQLLGDMPRNELDKISKMRSRPKILLARNYEDALYIFNKYKDYLLCVISDVEFDRNGKQDCMAGLKFIEFVRSHIINLPIILQSSDIKNETVAKKLKVHFINKNSDTLFNDLKNFLTQYLGFGDFIFRNKSGEPIAKARSLREFETVLKEIPDESFYIHATENQFSLWLMARGEIQLAKTLNPIRIKDFNSISESKEFFIETIHKYKEEKKKGKILSFDETATLDEKNIVAFAGGSYGGKGRGLAFINALINNLDYSTFNKAINIRSPITVIIGTDEFEYFMEHNMLYDSALNRDLSFQKIKEQFVQGHLSPGIIQKLEVFIQQIDKPIAIRSSSLSEDSLYQPFAGVFDTYILPNVVKDKSLALKHITDAIKLVYASIFSDEATTYFKAIQHRIEDEKMAIILQEFVGNRYENYYYPHISGVAQSYNYYPVANMKPEEGFAVAAVGLGSYVVNGYKSFRFSPRYPKIEMYTTKDLLNSTQVQFFAIDCSLTEPDFLKYGEMAAIKLIDISEAEKHDTIKHCSSVYNSANDRIEAGIDTYGPRIINFANILKYDYIPLAETIDIMLNTIKEALGSPVEIEYAVDLNKTINNLPSFYLLQIKPLVGSSLVNGFEPGNINRSDMLLYTESSLGNGEIEGIEDIIYVDVKKFDKLKTVEMADEIEKLNNILAKQARNYILIGPGRWGSRDRFIGIPVVWSQISNASIIVEISLANYPLDSSLGSHFFHNVTSMNIGYFSILDTSTTDFIRWDLLDKQNLVQKTKYFKHVRFNKPLKVLMNGKQRKSVITFNQEDNG